ncbi:conserved hypothetical protein [Alkaliphilus metalliredigens QYMF]|uniref:FMN-binding domain protein n=1 Tax=Alkaliphilus metalliredigens (strain QYMF) TaxID=293826 RepID=A6TVS6_ALKMQ|nr:hypothetical protein [Alkaliphilus metalliredigens]ABR50294.1 conserved hypothetical protein [Alkaliphilus metalliredigens QYMF]
MKKFITTLVVLILAGMVLTGCTTGAAEAEDTTNEQVADNDEIVEGEMVTIGLGHGTAIGKSKSLDGDTVPLAQVDTTMVAAGFDAEGKVVSVTIDVAQTKVDFDADVQLTSDKDGEFKTKLELGDDYGMKRASGIEKEWFEQAAALEEWMIGKTVAEIMAMELEENRPADADLITSATITVDTYLAALEEAYNNAVEVEAGAVKVGLGTEISIAKSKSAEGDNGALAQVDTTMNVVALDADGVVVGTIIDVAQTKIDIDVDGQITTDKDGDFKTKVELGDDYGMKRASGIEKEWFEQAASLEEWMTGRTIAEITAMELEEGRPAETDLVTSATVTVGGYISTIEKAAVNAK